MHRRWRWRRVWGRERSRKNNVGQNLVHVRKNVIHGHFKLCRQQRGTRQETETTARQCKWNPTLNQIAETIVVAKSLYDLWGKQIMLQETRIFACGQSCVVIENCWLIIRITRSVTSIISNNNVVSVSRFAPFALALSGPVWHALQLEFGTSFARRGASPTFRLGPMTSLTSSSSSSSSRTSFSSRGRHRNETNKHSRWSIEKSGNNLERNTVNSVWVLDNKTSLAAARRFRAYR